MPMVSHISKSYPMVSVGFKNLVARNRIIAIVSPNTRPVRNLISEARQSGKLIDATLGKKTKSVLIMDSDHVILSANTIDTLGARINEPIEENE